MTIVYSKLNGGKGKLKAYHHKNNPKEWVYEMPLFCDSVYVSIMHVYNHVLRLMKCRKDEQNVSGLYVDIENPNGYPMYYTLDIRNTEQNVKDIVRRTKNEGVVVNGDIVESDGSVLRYYDYSLHRATYIAPEQVAYKICQKHFAFFYEKGKLKSYSGTKNRSAENNCMMCIEEGIMEWLIHRIKCEWEEHNG